jgi:lipid II:glycine glycyltransferase (peptidoglycan interpeptide bridge formation enzyme)
MGSTVRKGAIDDLPAFYHLLQITGKRGNFSIRRMEYYEKEWEIFSEIDQVVMLMAFYQDQLLAGHIAVKFGDRAAYFHGGSINFPADTGVNYQLVWEAVKWAKTQGCRTFDLWGIPDEAGRIVSEGNEPPSSDRTDDLWGVYRFKKGFSKNIVCYIGAYDYVYNPVLYKLITNRFLNSNALERAAAWMDGIRTS